MPKPHPAIAPLLNARELWVAVRRAPLTGVDAALLGEFLARCADGRRRVVIGNKRSIIERLRRWGYTKGLNLDVAEDASHVGYAHDALVYDCDSIEDPRTHLAKVVRNQVYLVGGLPLTGSWWEKVPAAYNISIDDVPNERASRVRETMTEAEYERVFRLRVLEKSRSDIFEFASRLQIRDKAGVQRPLIPNDIQRRYHALKGPRTLILKHRRGGITTWEQACSYELTSRVPNTQAVTLAHTKDATKQIFRIAQMYHRFDPEAPQLKGVGNASRLEFTTLNSQFFIGTAGAEGFGRGDTLQRVHGSEVSKWCRGPRQREAVRDLVAGLTEAASHGQVILETTANGAEWFHDTWKEARSHQNDWTPIFIPWYWDLTCVDAPVEVESLTEREATLVALGASLEQIGWRRKKVRQLKGLFLQEYPEDDETCFITSGTMYFDRETIADLLDTLPLDRPPRCPGLAGYYVEWEPPIPGDDYVIGADTSEGRGQWNEESLTTDGCDPCGLGVIHRKSGRQVAAAHGLFTPSELGTLCVQTAQRYNQALVGVERNNHGHAVVLKITELGYSYYDQLYRDHDGAPGWVTDGASRPLLLDGLTEMMEHPELIKDRHMLSEMLTFKRQRNGKWEHDPSAHDDTIFKWGIAWQMRKVPLPRSEVLYA